MAETINIGVDVQYDPVSSGEESVSMYFYMDGILHKLIGSRGNIKISARANENPMLTFSFIGLFVDPTDAANPTLTLTGWTAPIAVNKANTPTFTLHTFAAVMASLELDLGNVMAHRDLVNSESVQIVDANGSGAVSIEAPALATKDFFAIAKAGTLGALQLIHGTVAGNIVQVDAPKVQVGAPGYGDSDGVAMLNMGLTVTPDAGDDELKITVK